MSLFPGIERKFDELDVRSKAFIRPQTVKDVFNISTGTAIFFLEAASRFGYVRPRYDVHCPNCGRIVRGFDYKFQIPKIISCMATDDCHDFEANSESVLVEKVYVFNEQ